MIGDNNVRILWGEPIIFPHLRKFIDIAEKWGFDILVFSNINISPIKFRKIFEGTTRVRVNCNINDEAFYTAEEKENIHANLQFLSESWIHTILWYNIVSIEKIPDFHIALWKKYGLKHLNFKITNSTLGGSLFIDTGTREFWKYVFAFIKEFYKDFQIEISCGLSPKIFSDEEKRFIEKEAKIEVLWGCSGHRWKFDINTDGSIFKCYPLESLYIKKKTFVSELLKFQENLDITVKKLYDWVYSYGECTAHKYIKGYV